MYGSIELAGVPGVGDHAADPVGLTVMLAPPVQNPATVVAAAPATFDPYSVLTPASG